MKGSGLPFSCSLPAAFSSLALPGLPVSNTRVHRHEAEALAFLFAACKRSAEHRAERSSRDVLPSELTRLLTAAAFMDSAPLVFQGTAAAFSSLNVLKLFQQKWLPVHSEGSAWQPPANPRPPWLLWPSISDF